MPLRLNSWSALARAPKAELLELQNRTLARYVNEELYPFSAHYRRVFDEARIRPRDIRTVADLRRLPFSTKQDLLASQSDPAKKLDFILVPTPERIRAHWPFSRKLAVALGGARAREILRRDYTPCFLTFTTGRSAAPVVFSYTNHDLDLLGESGARLLDVFAVPAVGPRILSVFPFAPHLAFWQVTFGGIRSSRLIVPTGGGKVMGTAGNLKLAERFQPTCIVGVPGFVYHMLREAQEKHVDLSKLTQIFLGAEKVTPGLKRKMAESLAACGAKDVSILGTYGFTEARMAYGECPCSYDDAPGFHLYPDLGIVEIVHPETLEPVGEDETGEIVYTPIAGHGTVLCRYRTGDVAVGGMTWEPCRFCGRTVPRISSELKRSSDQKAMNLTKIKGTLVDLPAMGATLSEMPEVEEWQVVLGKVNGDPHELDEFVVRVALVAGADRAAFERKAKQALVEATEVAPNRFEHMSREDLLAALGMETELKEKRFLDLRPK
ncbi:MAG TPA: AMP-binding protein [Planctomycetota bacterium]|jgi:phenylacetate-coenzyme A ligase PaaK-like adenylate-forming protein|nr:AMP-binding protein [Planctomycetota bacterium]